MGVMVLLMLQPKSGPARPAQATAAYGSAQMAIAEKRCDRAVERLAEAIAADATYWEGEWRQLMRRYRDACHGKTTTEVSTFRSESAFRDQWTTTTTTRNEDTPKCREILSDIDALADEIVGTMDGVDEELRLPPSVYPGIREEIFSKLRSELW